MISLSPSPRSPRTLKRASKRVNSLFPVTRRSLEISLTFNCKQLQQQPQQLQQQLLHFFFLDETVFLKYILRKSIIKHIKKTQKKERNLMQFQDFNMTFFNV